MATNGKVGGFQLGYLAADPSFKRNADGSMVANFRILTTLTHTAKDKVTKVDETVGLWYELRGTSAENFSKFMKKGMRVDLDFTIRNDEYEDPATPGKKIYRDRYRVTRWLSLTPKGDTIGGTDEPPSGSEPHEFP